MIQYVEQFLAHRGLPSLPPRSIAVTLIFLSQRQTHTLPWKIVSLKSSIIRLICWTQHQAPLSMGILQSGILVWVALPSSKELIRSAKMAPHSSTLAWKIPWMEEPGRLQSMASPRVGHDWATSLSLFTFIHWRRQWQPTPVFLPGESQGRGSLVGCRLWGRTESDTTEVT